MNRIELVVFDMAGTTVTDRHEVEYCFAEACEATGLDVSKERILAMQGYAKKEVFRILWSEQMQDCPKDELEQQVDFSYRHFCEILENHYQNSEILPTEKCLETFELLRKNEVKIALTTGFYRKVANIILDKLGWLSGLDSDFVNRETVSPIDVSVTPSEVGKGRPHPFMIERAMSLLNIQNPENVVKVGDTPVDLEEGYNAGCWKSFAVTNGTHTYDELRKYKNDGLLNNLEDLPRFLNLDKQKEKGHYFTF